LHLAGVSVQYLVLYHGIPTLAEYSYTEDIAERFLLEVESVLRVYARRAKIAKEIIDSKK